MPRTAPDWARPRRGAGGLVGSRGDRGYSESAALREGGRMRARRSCLSVPGSSPKMLAKAAGLPADEVFFDLEDSVAPLEKEAARGNVVEALKGNQFEAPAKVLRVNGVYTKWCAKDLLEVVEAVGEQLDCIMIPKVETVSDVKFVSNL